MKIAPNDRVYALWRGNGCYYNATVLEVHENSCTVHWDDSDDSHRVVPFSEITKEEAETTAWPMTRINSAVFVEMTPNKGRCLFTSRQSDAGGVIFIESPTLVAIPSLAPGIWKQLQDMHEAQPLELGTITFYFAAVASLLILDGDGLQIILDKFVPDTDESASDDVCRIIKTLDTSGYKQGNINPKMFQRLLSAWRYNSFGHHTEDGLVMYNRISMCAHSCDPSCCWSFGDDDAFVLRARRALGPREELTISYLQDDDLLKSIAVRRQKLNNWKFTCACERCIEIIDYARGFRCGKCKTGSCYYTTEGPEEMLTKCKMCNFVYSKIEVKSLMETEESYCTRVENLNKTDIPDVELVYSAALDPFAEHWCLYCMDTILFESYRDKGNFLEASEHQQRRIHFHNSVFPRVTFILAWAHEELADMLQRVNRSGQRQGNLAVWMARYRQATGMLSILCGPTHVYTQGPQNKWQSLQASATDGERERD